MLISGSRILQYQFPGRLPRKASVAFNVGGILGGAAAPIVAQWLGDRGGTNLVGLYLTLAGVVSWIGLMMVRRATSV